MSISKKRRKPIIHPDQLDANLLDVNEVADLLKLSVSHVYTLTSRKQIPHMKVLGKKILFDRNEIIEWVKSKKVSVN